jgi:hypothetical protein
LAAGAAGFGAAVGAALAMAGAAAPSVAPAASKTKTLDNSLSPLEATNKRSRAAGDSESMRRRRPRHVPRRTLLETEPSKIRGTGVLNVHTRARENRRTVAGPQQPFAGKGLIRNSD